MRTVFSLALAVLLAASMALSQAGPKQTDKKAKRDTTTTTEPAKPDTTKKQTAKPAKPAKSSKPAKPAKPAEPAKAAEPDTTKKKPAEPAKPPVPEKTPEAKVEKVKSVPEKKVMPEEKGRDAQTTGHLKRALFTTAIEEREPVDNVDSLSTATEVVYFFTDIVGLQGRTVTHRWTYGGEVHAEVPIEVKSQRWRAYSSKKLLPAWQGEWKVEFVDEDGNILGTKRLFYYRAEQDN